MGGPGSGGQRTLTLQMLMELAFNRRDTMALKLIYERGDLIRPEQTAILRQNGKVYMNIEQKKK